MYRAFVGGRWLPWVSNADPQWMQNVKNKFSLDGTLDTTGYYAGLDGQNISGLEIHVFEDSSSNPGSGDFSGSEIRLATSYMFDNLSNWNTFDKTVTADHIDGVKIQTDSTHGFYLTYQTWNQGQGGFYPEVTSLQNDYAGSAGKPIQLLSIRAYKSDGTKLTSGVVIMYRALVNGRWLPWVSNADPQWMDSVKSQYNLDGTLDYTSYYAGIDGQNISGLEIRAFVGTTNDTPIEGLVGQEAPPTLSYMVDNNWTNFDKSVIPGRLDGLKIQTDASKPYYITYQTWNQGRDNYYPFVTSRENDYAGSAGKPIQRLGLYVYRNDGTKLVTGVVVMYRAYVEGRWLPWVSNANPEWMRSVQAKYNLDGTLDDSAYYAGIDGKNISGIEVRIFEENNTDIPTPEPSGKSKIIDAPFISQKPSYPTGCESVATVMALQYAGVNISVDKFIDNYLYKTGMIFDPNESFGGNPRGSGYGCYSPVIKNALDKCFVAEGLSTYSATELKNVSLQQLCTDYIDKDIPVIMWATIDMRPWYNGDHWYYNGKKIQWIAPEHCLLLVGYDDQNYIFNDPWRNKQTYYRKSAVEAAYAGLFKQAIVINIKKSVDDPAVLNEVYKLKIREVLSAFPAAKLDQIPVEQVVDCTFNVLSSPSLDIDVTTSVGVSRFPSNTTAVYNIKDGKLSVDSSLTNVFLKPGVSMSVFDLMKNGVSLRDIALKVSDGKITVIFAGVDVEGTILKSKISYMIETEVKLPNNKISKLTIEVLYTVKKDNSIPPSSAEEEEYNKAVNDMGDIYANSPSFDWSAVGSFFSAIGTGTVAFFSALGTACTQFFAFMMFA